MRPVRPVVNRSLWVALALVTIGTGLLVRAVVPGVMGMEAFAEAATALVPGWEVHSIRDVAFLAPFKLYRDEPRVAEVRARLLPGGDGTLVAECELIGRRTLPGQPEQATTHFVGTVVLARAGAVPASGP